MAARAEVEYYKDEAGEWRWRLKAGNGEIVATGEGYTRLADAQYGFEDAVRAAQEAFEDTEEVAEGLPPGVQ